MIKADERRAALLDRLADHVVAEGLSGSSLRPLAKAAGVSDRMLLYYFVDKADLIAATLERVAERLVGMLDARSAKAPLPFDDLRVRLMDTLLADEFWPYMRIWLEVASLASRGDPFYRAIGERIGRGFLAWGSAQLESANAEAREVEAARLLVMTEGMLLLKSIGLDDVCRRAV